MYQIPLDNELIIDNFAGGGGASVGIEMALKRPVNISINHDPEAVTLHKANHSLTKHYCEDVWEVNPRELCAGRRVALAWFSPDCKHFSKAKGGKPVEKKIRGLAWVVLRWASLSEDEGKPRVIILENVEEFLTWGPLQNGRPCPKNKGRTFRSFVNALRRHGYHIEWRELRACDYGVPTIRKRLFLIARCDGQPIIWPKPTHGDSLLPYKTAADCIDWSIPCPTIFTRKRPLADNTLKRIAKGLDRFVFNNPQPFIVEVNHSGEHFRGQSIAKPMNTMTAKNGRALIMPYLTEHANASSQRVFSAEEPLRTQCAQVKGGHFSLVTGHIMKMRGSNIGHAMNEPLHTISAGGTHHAAVHAFLVKYYGNDKDPVSLRKPLGTVTTKDRFGLVRIDSTDYILTDIGMRMLSPRELYNAQGFPDDYIIDTTHNGKPLTKTAQVRMCGNSVCPGLAKALVECNVAQSYALDVLTRGHG